MSSHILTILILFLVIDSGCRNKGYQVDIGDIHYNAGIERFEDDIFGGDTYNLSDRKDELSVKYGEFLSVFSYLINIKPVDDEGWGEGIVSFATDRLNWEVYNEVKRLYPDIEEVRNDLTEACRHIKYYFPEIQIPVFYTCVSGFNSSIVVGDSVMGIGLDRYLGRDSKYYPMLGIYTYLSHWMIPEKIVPDCIYSFAKTNWVQDNDNVSLLSSMMYEGRLLYFSRSMMPDQPDTLLFNFTTDQLKFCRNNESNMWEYLIEHDLLYNTDPLLVRKFTGEAPFTGYFTNESPGRAAVWVAFRIIESYMANNPGVSLEELMNNNDWQGILNAARYSP